MGIKRSMKKLFSGMAVLTLLSFVLWGGQAQAYSISGTVTDANGPVPAGEEVELYILHAEAGATMGGDYSWEEWISGVHTNANGVYSFEFHEDAGGLEFYSSYEEGTTTGIQPGQASFFGDWEAWPMEGGLVSLTIADATPDTFTGAIKTTMDYMTYTTVCSFSGTGTLDDTTGMGTVTVIISTCSAGAGPQVDDTIELELGEWGNLETTLTAGGGSTAIGFGNEATTQYLIKFGSDWGDSDYKAKWYYNANNPYNFAETTMWDGKSATIINFSLMDPPASITGIDGVLSAGKTISGWVRDNDGVTALTSNWGGGVDVTLFHEEADDWGEWLWWEGWTNANTETGATAGNYTLKGVGDRTDYVVEGGNWDSVRAYYNSAGPNNLGSTTTYTKIDASGAGNITGINIKLPQTVGISGTLTAPASGNISGSEVILFQRESWSDGFEEWSYMMWVKSQQVTATGLSGAYAIPGVSDGTYYVGAEKVDWGNTTGPLSPAVVTVTYARTLYDGSATGGTTSEHDAAPVTVAGAAVTGINITFQIPVGISGNFQEDSVTVTATNPSAYWVDTYSEDTGSWGYAENDASGNYSITGLGKGTGYVVSTFNNATYAYKMWNGTVTGQVGDRVTGTNDWMHATRIDLTGGTVTGVDFNLAPATGSIAGTIELPTTPTSSIMMWLDAYSETSWSGGWADVTIASGTDTSVATGTPAAYTINGLNNTTTDYVVAAWPDWNTGLKGGFYGGSKDGITDKITSDWMKATRLTANTLTGIDFTFSAGKTVKVSVTLGSAAIVSTSGWIDLWSESEFDWAGRSMLIQSGETVGNATITGVGSARDYRLSAWFEGYMNVFYSGSKDGTTDATTTDWNAARLIDPTGIASGESLDMTLTGGSAVSGSVSLSSGTASSTIWIWLDAFNNTTYEWNWADTSIASGANSTSTDYSLIVTDGSWHITPWAYGYIASGTDVTVSGDTTHNITLGTGCTWSGTVDDGTNGVYGVWMDVTDSDWMWYGGTVTASDGTYSISGLPCSATGSETYSLQTWPSDFANMSMTVDPDLGNQTVNVTLSAGIKASGQITDANSNGVAYAWISVWYSDGVNFANDEWLGTESDSSGNYSMAGFSANASGGSDKAYNVNIYSPGYPIGTGTITIAASDTPPNLTGQDFVMGGGEAITGEVTGAGFDPSTTQGYVGLYKDTGDSSFDMATDTFLDCVVIENNGTYRTFPVSSGLYYLMAVIPGFEGPSITVTSAEVTTAITNEEDISGKDITVSSTSANNISGTVTLGSAAAACGAGNTCYVYVNALNAGGTFKNGTTVTFTLSDTSVDFTISDLSAGSYTIKAMGYDESDSVIPNSTGTQNSVATGTTNASLTLQ